MNEYQKKQREAIIREMRRSAETGQPMDRTQLPAGWSFSTPTFYLDAQVLWRWLLLLVVLASLLFVPARSQAAGKCDDTFDHHTTASPYFQRLMTEGRVWTEGITSSVIAAVWIAECGRYLIGIWRNDRFVTHFLTSWGYIINQLRGFTRVTWGDVLVRSWWIILVPCPGTWMGHPNAWTRPCPTPEQT